MKEWRQARRGWEMGLLGDEWNRGNRDIFLPGIDRSAVMVA